jgi:uncharacterized protein (TIGR00369 family)
VTPARTHERLDPTLCGRPVALADGRAEVELMTTDTMVADERGLVHGGFLFGLADHAAMLAVNEPTVVLGAASVTFLRPVRRGDRVVATGTVEERKGRRRVVGVRVRRAEEVVMEGRFECVVLDHHVLD